MSTNLSSISFNQMQGSAIGSFWRRTLAFIADGLFLFAFGRVAGYLFFGTLSLLGPWTRLIGFCLALAYFSILECGIGGGQTLGKRLLRLRVVDAHGDLIKWKWAAIRYAIFATPHFLAEPKYTVDIRTWIAASLIIFIELGVGGSTVYLLVFNRHTRQGLHDLASGAYVVDSDVSGPLRTEPIWRLHWWVIAVFLFLIVFAELSRGVSVASQPKSAYFSQSRLDESLIEKLDKVQAADVRIWIPIPFSGSALGRFLPKQQPFTVVVQWTGERGMREALADQVAGIVLKCDPRTQKQDLIQIEIGRSYDLGIASGKDYESFTHTQLEWDQRVFGYPPASNTLPAHQ